MVDVSGEGVSPTEKALESQMAAQQSRAESGKAGQTASKASFAEEASEAFNPFAADKEIQFKSMRERAQSRPSPGEMVHTDSDEAAAAAWERAKEKNKDNYELDSKTLRDLRNRLLGRGDNTSDEIFEEVFHIFEDPILADEALEYLEETTYGLTKEQVSAARDILEDRFGEETLTAGRNMGAESREFATMGLDSPKTLRELYRDVTTNPREGNKLFQELNTQFGFDKLKRVIEFLLRSLGADLKSKGPSISRGELSRLMTETRVLQSILGVFSFFLDREKMIRQLFEDNGIPFTDALAFEELARSFIDLVDERYPTSAKMRQIAAELGIDEDTLAQIIVFTQYRDAIRQVAPRLYRSMQHRYDLLMAIIEALEEYEEEYEVEEDE